MAPPRKSLRLALELSRDPSLISEQQFANRNVLRRLWQLVDDRVTDGDRGGLHLARLCCRLSGRLATAEARAGSFARLASALRLANRLDHAGRTLEIALATAPSYMKGDVLRRRAILRIYEGRLAESVEDAEAALELTIGAEHARALEALGVALYNRGEHRAAIRQLHRCLAATEPDDNRYCNAIHNYATALSKGSRQEAARALELCSELRPRLKYRHKMQRSKLWWTEGLLHHRLGDEKQAWRSLNHARRSLVPMKAAAEVAAIIADMAIVSPQQPAVRILCDGAAEVIAAHRTLTRHLESLASAAREMIPEAAAMLKEAASQLAPCPAL